MGDDNKVVIYTPDLILFKEDRGGMVDQRGR
jgi:hypothetical protein